MSGPKEKQAMTKSAFIKEVHDAEAMLYHVAKSILKNDADCCDFAIGRFIGLGPLGPYVHQLSPQTTSF